MSIEIETTCRACDRTWTPAHRDYVAGVWQTCPQCRGHPQGIDPEPGTASRGDPGERATDTNPRNQGETP